MFDYHVHSCYSLDCTFDMESYILPAIDKELKGICFTDHVDIDYPGTVQFELDYNKYINEINRLKDKYRGKLEILTGIEFGMQPHILKVEADFFKDKCFDYVIGSLHAAGKKELYGGDFLTGKSNQQGIIDYFNDMIFCIRNFKSYNNLGHLDAIARYVDKGSFEASKYMGYIEEVLNLLIKFGKGIEINTSGRRYSLPYFHPEPSIVKLYKELGGNIVTLGSDSHKPDTLAYGFKEAIDMLQSLGFNYYTIFRNGEPEFIKI